MKQLLCVFTFLPFSFIFMFLDYFNSRSAIFNQLVENIMDLWSLEHLYFLKMFFSFPLEQMEIGLYLKKTSVSLLHLFFVATVLHTITFRYCFAHFSLLTML